MKNKIITLSIFATILLIYGCQKNADCLLPEGGCNCPDGFEGKDCETRVTTKFLGKFKIASNDNYTMTVLDSVQYERRVFFQDYYSSSSITSGTAIGSFYGIVDGTHITIPRQPFTRAVGSFYKTLEGDACIETVNNKRRFTFNVKFDQSPYLTRTVFLNN